ncbi:CoA pyrophosphatase [Nocardioides sp. YIM 152315]|uniref:NUDIX hydrolase n=1 Tax=Nocardioides sp. YIM 152315 TaxID=3031760 RepID=UPI0023DB166E|nr:CoA pyrophosphatase [Nocardioides sp. YIM 152315]MDF1603602.1 CoA pyrophosphatase [Nocardioides sp. YIM 152315]
MSDGPTPGLPDWLRPVERAARQIQAEDLTRFVPPPGGDARRGAVLMLFGEGPHGGELLLTERAHDMRSHPGQVSFPGGSVDAGEDVVEAALREADEEVGVDPGTVTVFGRLPELWLPPSNFAVTPVLGWWAEPTEVSVVSHAEVHAIHHVPLAELVDPSHRITVRMPRGGYQSPGFLIGPDHDVILWGFTGGIIARLLDFLGWSVPWDESRVRDLPAYMFTGQERRGRSADLLDIDDDQRRGGAR